MQARIMSAAICQIGYEDYESIISVLKLMACPAQADKEEE
jgi:hypothetical protein